jgi:nucleoside-diphosphate-sugar epimerase
MGAAVANFPNVIAVTGAGGFVGQALLQAIATAPGLEARGLFRTMPHAVNPAVDARLLGDLAAASDLGAALAGVRTVIHAAARTHVLDDTAADPEAAYRRTNVEGTRNLARAAAAAGVKRLVYVSSVKVNGEQTSIDRPFTEADAPAPEDAYGRTKWEAEQLLASFAGQHGLEIVILRPPLVYGPGVKGNLARLMRLVARGVPLPLGSVRNRRSMIGLDNLVSAILVAAEHRSVAGRTFLVSDQHDLSTPDLIRLIAAAQGRPARLLPFPPQLLGAVATLAGRGGEIARLTGSLAVDSNAFSRATKWQPVVPVREEIARMVAAG